MAIRYFDAQRREISAAEDAAISADGIDLDADDCPRCRPFPCDCSDAQRPEAVPSRYTPLRNRGCRCGADFHGGDCMCFEGN
jgi:hypothetical protein